MNIGKASQLTGLNSKTIRYYEDIELIRPDRRDNGYRDYSDRHIEILNFLKVARSLSFSIENCRALLGMYRDENRASKDVKQLVAQQISELDEIIANSLKMKATLQHLSNNCHGDNRPQCAILDAFSAGIVNKSDQMVK
ncbi:MAG: MerR family transcriptional regulator [OCS116 cluster bacterium]|uniref:Cu(I)-responsive transcriptional regulator n=1 Tax=OCS116 cluster bacterium TaxID=2030921 RepID=A0A2A4Z8Q8_9PROT|nr:MerR family transcriptional regulator [OCS116 cluster bacterium]